MGDYLIVSITSDSKLQKGLGRPLYKEKERIEFLSSISVIDYLYIDHHRNAVGLISKIKPNIYAKGSDYIDNDFTGQILKEKNTVKKYSGKLIFTDEQTFSASNIINKLTLNNQMITLIKNIKKDFSFEKVNRIINKLKDNKILIILSNIHADL
jgi:bifunctional ADP-heptose synthase (sugar kinase/adenylyltransferase)